MKKSNTHGVKRLFSMILAVCLASGLAVPAMAADNSAGLGASSKTSSGLIQTRGTGYTLSESGYYWAGYQEGYDAYYMQGLAEGLSFPKYPDGTPSELDPAELKTDRDFDNHPNPERDDAYLKMNPSHYTGTTMSTAQVASQMETDSGYTEGKHEGYTVGIAVGLELMGNLPYGVEIPQWPNYPVYNSGSKPWRLDSNSAAEEVYAAAYDEAYTASFLIGFKESYLGTASQDKVKEYLPRANNTPNPKEGSYVDYDAGDLEGSTEGYEVGYCFGAYYSGKVETIPFNVTAHANLAGMAKVYIDEKIDPEFSVEPEDTSIAGRAVESNCRVQYNGEYLTFTDAKPLVADNRTFLPFRAVFEAIGAKVDYDEDTKTVSATRDGIKVAMVIGSKEITVTPKQGYSTVSYMDVQCFAKNNRTYVPVRYAAEAFGLSVGWDGISFISQGYGVVILVDKAKLLDEALKGNKYSTLKSALNVNSSRKVNLKKGTYELNTEYEFDAWPFAVTKPANVSATMRYLIKDSQKYQLTAKSSGTLESLDETDRNQLINIPGASEAIQNLAVFAPGNMEVRGDYKKGVAYYKFPDGMYNLHDVDAKKWYKSELSGSYENAFEVFESFVQYDSDDVVRRMVSQLAEDEFVVNNAYNCDHYIKRLNAYAGMFSNDGLTKTTKGYESEYSHTLDGIKYTVTFNIVKKGETVQDSDDYKPEAVCELKSVWAPIKGQTNIPLTYGQEKTIRFGQGITEIDETYSGSEGTSSLKLRVTAVKSTEDVTTTPPSGSKTLDFKDIYSTK